jgi:hypothetical protein
MRSLTVAAVALATACSTPAFADIYTQANFSGGTFGGGANVKSPFSGNGFFPGQTFSGTFVYDNNLIPAAGSGYVNVSPSSFPDAASIPASAQFTFNFGSLTFTPTGADLFAIQYNNGAFNGFAYIDTFSFQGGTYQLNIQGGTLSVYEVVGGQPTFNSLVNGYINIGNAALTGKTAYTPGGATPAVPEPATWAMMLVGFGAIGGAMRRQRTVLRLARAA